MKLTFIKTIVCGYYHQSKISFLGFTITSTIGLQNYHRIIFQMIEATKVSKYHQLKKPSANNNVWNFELIINNIRIRHFWRVNQIYLFKRMNGIFAFLFVLRLSLYSTDSVVLYYDQRIQLLTPITFLLSFSVECIPRLRCTTISNSYKSRYTESISNFSIAIEHCTPTYIIHQCTKRVDFKIEIKNTSRKSYLNLPFTKEKQLQCFITFFLYRRKPIFIGLFFEITNVCNNKLQ